MNIGYDGKRAFQNKTGLGNYSRSLLSIVSRYFPQHQYKLFAPKQTHLFDIHSIANIRTILPDTLLYQKLPALWRRRGMVKQIAQAQLDIYHGLSNELPSGIKKTNIKTVVTVHDLIFERFPQTYHFDERYTHRWKIKRACKIADTVIAISEQTKNDLIDFYEVPAQKISVCHQSCNPIFEQAATAAEKASVKKKYQLPDRYFLFVSSIAPRKNLITLCKAMIALKEDLPIPLVIIGDGKTEKEEAKKLMKENGMEQRLLLLNELPAAKEDSFTSAADFPAIYQQALALVYPSLFEGFGLPILEAMWSGLPVICSNTSSMPEVAGDAALYFSPHDTASLAQNLQAVASDERLVQTLREKGLQQAKKFGAEQYANSIMQVYKNLL
jgi:glycosyltransferase involved in cell wall biosynthesis